MSKKKFLSLLILLLATINSFSQDYTPEEIRIKTDSILMEGNILFNHEKAAWIATDMAMENESVRKNFGGFLSYMLKDTIIAIIYNREDFNYCIYELQFVDSFDKPVKESFEKRVISELEKKLIIARDRIIDEIILNEFEVFVPDGFSLNFVILPFEQGYKLYILTGTSQPNIIPFGNDYIFIADSNYEITYWRKFHSRLIPQSTVGPGGEQVRSLTHSHLRTEPFISATDICTFMLYGGYYGLNEFSVYSPALSLYFTYRLDKNEILISERP